MKTYLIYLALLCPLLTCAQLINDDYCRDVHPDATLWYADFDGDGYRSPLQVKCAVSRPSGYTVATAGLDCDDTNASIQGPKTYYRDADNDNYGDSNDKKVSCTFPSGYTTRGGDCNDNDPNAHTTQTYYRDVDGDSYGNSSITKVSCGQPTGYVLKSGDCNDNNPNIHPGLSDGCTIDGIDNNCNGVVDENKVPTPTLHSITNDCGVTTLRQNIHLTQFDWYWQSSPTGTSTANSADEITRTTGTVYYLRSRKQNTNCWSDALTINYRVHQIPGIPAAPSIQKNCGTTVLTKPTAPQGITWYWQNSATATSTASSAASITKTTNGTTYLRGKSDDDCWGSARTIAYTVTQPTTWYGDGDGDGFGDPNTSLQACTQPTGYVANNNDQCPDEYGTKQGCVFTPYTPLSLSNENYIFTQVYQTPMQSATEIKFNKEVIEQVTYYDGLGRPMQQNSIRASNTDKDIITHIAYEEDGRQHKDYLPYEASGAFGSYRAVNVTTDINSYYKTKYPQDFSEVTTANVNAYTERIYEPSPLGRVIEQGAPGTHWKADPNNDADHTLIFDWDTNVDTEVRYFRVAFINGDPEHPQLRQDGYYPKHSLYMTRTQDENWISSYGRELRNVKEYKDKAGRIVLKRTYVELPDAEEPTQADTYYVYDDFGNLTYVLPPKVNTYEVTETDLAELCYQYRYDHRNRLIAKKVPGKGWESIVYNTLDQPVLTQDALLAQKDQWLFTKYDAFGRIAYTGIITDTDDRDNLQTELDAFSGVLWVTASGSSTTLGGAVLYYNNGGYPDAQNAEVLTVNYYDHYAFLASESAVLQAPATVYGAAVSDRTRSLPTGSKIKVLETNDWITSATYYDTKARPIYTVQQNAYLQTTDQVASQLDFVGKVLETTTTHTQGTHAPIKTVDSYTYDHMGRALTHTQTINEQPTEQISSHTYDALGQLQSKAVGGQLTDAGHTPLQDIAYSYNVRGWLTGINDPTALGTDLFGSRMQYDQVAHGGYPLYNGNISEISWATANDHTQRWYSYRYDVQNRITAAISNDGRYSLSEVTYDKAGNILSLHRRGPMNTAATSFGGMDILSYQYKTDSNKLLSVTENGSRYFGFTETITEGNDYAYDANGNMISDQNKGITGITYNHLNMPKTVSISNNTGVGNIRYIYDATGAKQQKIVSAGSSLTTTSYAGAYIYKNGTLEFFNHPEGYLEPKEEGYQYIYQYKDHLGNIRLSYADTNTDGSITSEEIKEEKNYYPFGMQINYGSNSPNSMITGRKHNYGYNGVEENNELGLNLLGMDFRQYDPAIARFTGIDPITHHSMSTYTAFDNNPIFWADPSGADATSYVMNLFNSASSGYTRYERNDEGDLEQTAHASDEDIANGKAILVAFPDQNPKIPTNQKAARWFERNFGDGDEKVEGAGHAGIVIIDGESGNTRYFDFGRYRRPDLGALPEDTGAVRSSKNYGALSIPNWDFERSNEQNVTRILRAIQRSPLFKGYGTIMGSLAEGLDYKAMLKYATEFEKQGYHPFGGYSSSTNCKNASYCAKFARGVAEAGGFDWSWYVLTGKANVENVEKASGNKAIKF